MSLMGSVKKAIFGEKPSISNVPTLSTEQQELLNSLISQVQGSLGTGVSAYPGDMYADASGLNQGLFSMAGGLMEGGGQGQDILDQLLSKYSGQYTEQGFDPSSTIDMFNTSVRNPAMKEFNETILPGIAEKYAGQNAGRSGAVLKTMTDSASDLETGLSGQLSQYLYNAENQNKQNELSKYLNFEDASAGILPNLMSTAFNQPINTMNAVSGVADVQQNIDQNQLTEDYQKWGMEQPYNNPWLQYIQSMLGTQTTQPVVNQGSSGLLAALAPGIGMGLGSQMGAGLMPSGGFDLAKLFGLPSIGMG